MNADTVKVGQVWASCDPRDWPRKVKVVRVDDDRAQVENLSTNPDVHYRNVTGRKTWVRLSSFRQYSRGFRLVEDV